MEIIELTTNSIAVTGLPEGAYNISPSNPKLTNKNYLMFDLHHYGRFVSESKRGKQTIDLPPGNWSILGYSQELTEEQWRGVVEKMPWGEDCYKNYLHQSPRSVQLVGKTATESGHSLLKSKDIDLLPNPLILIKQDGN